jgi:amidase
LERIAVGSVVVSGDAEGLAFAGCARQAALVRAGEVSPRELVELYLERIDRLNPRLNAFREVFGDEALSGAAEAQRRLRTGDQAPLLGVPVAIKDDVDIEGKVTACGSRAHGPPATADSELVRRLRAAGAIPIGRTTASELMIWNFTETEAFGTTRNPWDLGRTPGGSSGGSAAAVAAGLVGVATGSDGLGSIRIPAACCGIFGLKPQRSRVSWAPLREAWHGLGVLGPLTRRVADAALMLDVIAGNVRGDPPGPPPAARSFAEAARTAPKKLRVAVSRRVPPPVLAGVERQAAEAIDSTAELLRSLGHDVREHEVSYGTTFVHASIMMFRGVHDAAHAMARPELLEPRTKAVARLGALIPPGLLATMRAREKALTAGLGRVFGDHDVVLAPVLTRPVIEVERWRGRGAIWTLLGAAAFTPFTGPWNAAGNPACAIPTFDAGGIPLGVQLVGRPNDEGTLLALAAQLEAETGWSDRRPPCGT